MIPNAKIIKEFQAPTAAKLYHRCENYWHIVTAAGLKGLKPNQRSAEIPIMGENEDMIKEVISILESKDFGYTYSYRLLKSEEQKQDDNGWITGYLVFSW